ncbi:MerR family transcriptional regulator [Desulfohalovibrio reitneri]|uniref:MerR family transcriptional regulator n=1 Tax=Desulfohalovibrio reitneri TaxID=1307759 RepID=UPI0004A71556|nr:MerR family transcriptional regulator [Desulfohalovibrio reitneri]
MTAKKLLSIANIARELNIPESTLHYWKNRFAEYLPSVGRGRQKRFRPEALDVFRTISDMLKMGHTTRDVKQELTGMYPLNIEPSGGAAPAVRQSQAPAANVEEQARLAAAMGQEIAKSLGQQMGECIRAVCGDLPALRERLEEMDDYRQAVEALQEENDYLRATVDELRRRLDEYPAPGSGGNGGGSADTADLHRENAELRDKLGVLEQELVRLRKDRREMEKFLLSKIKAD